MTEYKLKFIRHFRKVLIVSFLVFSAVLWLLIKNDIFLVFGILTSLAVTTHILIRLSTIAKPYSKTQYKLFKDYEPLVSVHVACKSEPYDIVNKTVEALTKLDYKNYEVVVINSNSTDRANWEKIRDYVKSLGSNYKFVHLDKVSGFKAGALNHIANKYTDKDAEIIAIVDSDYLVKPDFLSKTVGYFKNPEVGIVQAPQDYYNVDDYNQGLFYEYRSFFSLVMHQAQRLDFVNFTGTMGLIRADLLSKEKLKWSEWCITEDTEAGVRINALGYKGVYVDKSLGEGLMPYDYASLARQRQRWVYGNAQILWNDFIYTMLNPIFNIKQKFSFISQLVAWFHFDLLIALIYLIINSLALLIPSEPIFTTTSAIIAISLIASIVANLLYFLVGLRKDTSVINRIKAFLAHYGLIYVMSSGWIIYILGYKLGFNVTTKENSNHSLKLKNLLCELMVSLLLAITLVIKVLAGNIVPISVIATSLFIMTELCGVIYLNWLFTKSNKIEE